MTRCVRKRKSSVQGNRPGSTHQRREMLKTFGPSAFLFPEGTPSKPGVPAYPIVSARDGCLSCSMMLAAYRRININMAATKSRAYKADLRLARQRLIERAIELADRRDSSNACNFAYSARKKYPRW